MTVDEFILLHGFKPSDFSLGCREREMAAAMQANLKLEKILTEIFKKPDIPKQPMLT